MIGRTLDAESGAVIRTQIIDSLPVQTSLDKKYQSYQLFVGTDSSQIAFGAYVFDPATKTFGM
jgi:hypothetical protein